ncbi:MAG TPA: multicopper oxidase domain-containing protein [Vicinamibacterales bacterium]|nr:multicopper oxidase domain-containing protein [Vicinamibacterales bacterium]
MSCKSGATVLSGFALLAVLAVAAPAAAQNPNGTVYVQCPGDADGNSIPDSPNASIKCLHLAAGDGFVTMADGSPMYIFGFSDVTGTDPAQVLNVGNLSANFPAPTIRLKEGQEFYLNLTNVGMVMRPDLFDPHSVHFHGFPQAAPVFDGVPESSAVVNMGSTFTYYYKIVDPGTYMYHCHVEATEHMQMGMLGNLYVEPRQNGTLIGGYTTFAYNDGDGSTGYDVEYPIQLGSFDPNFHDQHINVQPLPFAAMDDKYALLNGRGYPDTINTAVMSTDTDAGPKPSQPVHSLVVATQGQRVLLRLSNLSVTRLYTIQSMIPMRVVGKDAKLHRGPDGKSLYYTTNSVTIGGGESFDVILDTAAVAPGTYLLYTTNLNYLSNNGEDLGGMMTEIRIQ